MQATQKKFIPQPQDFAMESFRQMFPAGFLRCFVYDDGRKMNYKCIHLPAAMDNLKRAKEIISQQNLPLTAAVFSDYCNHILTITYTAAKPSVKVPDQMEDCLECDGSGKVHCSCCGDDVKGTTWEDIDICPTCREHLGGPQECETCGGSGKIIMEPKKLGL